MKNFGLNEAECYIKRCLKGKISFSKTLVISFLMIGVFSFDAYGAGKKNIVVNEQDVGTGLNPKNISTIGKDGMTIGAKSVILSEGARDGIKGRKVNLNNNDPEMRFREVSYGNEGALGITNAGNDPSKKFETTIESVLIGHRSVGYAPSGSPKNLVAIGHMAAATTNAVALGDNTAAVGDGTIAIGKDTYVGKGKSVSIGYKSYSYHTGTVGIGPFNYIAGDYGVAIGYNSVLQAENAVAIGYNARVDTSKPGSVAIGSYSKTSATDEDLKLAGYDPAKGKNNTGNTWIPNYGEFAVGDSATKTRRITGVAAGYSDTDAVNVAQLKNVVSGAANLDYTANGNNKQTIDITKKALNFTSTDNIKTAVEKDGVVKHTLNSTLTGIAEIKKADNQGALKLNAATASLESAKDNSNVKLEANKATLSAGNDKANVEVNTTGATISAGKDKASISAKDSQISLSSGKNGKTLTYGNDGKLSGLEDGAISEKSTEAVNGSQIYKIEKDVLGLTENTAKNGFDAPKFTPIKDAKGTDGTAATSFKDAINANTAAINQGFKVAGDTTANGTTANQIQYLGSTINVKSGDFSAKAKEADAVDTEYKAKNLKTEYSYENGNGTIKIGLTENPEFKSVEFNNGEADAKIAKISTDKDGNISILTQVTKDAINSVKNVKIEGDKVSGVNKVGADDKNNISFEKASAGAGGAQTPAKAKITVDEKSVEFKKSTTTDETDKILISNVASPIGDYDAANKKYVDNKIKDKTDEISNNVPVVYTDKDGNKIIKKGQKFFKTNTDGTINDQEEYNGDVYVSVKKVDKQKSGLGLDEKSDLTEEQAKKTITDLTKETKESSNLNNVATIRDLQALGKAGMDFAGNDGEVHRNLGEKLFIKGDRTKPKDGTAANKAFESAQDNINVVVDDKKEALIIQLSNELKNLKSVEFDGEIRYGGDHKVPVKTKLDAEGLVLKEIGSTSSTDLLKTTNYGIGKASFKAEKNTKPNKSDRKDTQIDYQGTLVRDTENKLQAKYYADGTIINELDDTNYGDVKVNGKTAEYKLERAKISDGTDTLENTAKGITLKHKAANENANEDAKEVFSIKTDAAGAPTIDFKHKDNDKFTGKITGLADLDDKATGDMAANKNYVDSKLAQASADSPIETIYKAEDGKEVVKYGDKFYKKEEVDNLPAGAKFDAKKNKFVDEKGVELNGQPTALSEVESKKVKEDKLNVKGSPKQISNVKSGLGLTNETTIEDAKSKVNKLLGNNIPETENLKSKDPILNNVATVLDIQALGQTGIDFVGNDGKTLVHRNLGQTLTIKGDQTDKITTNTIATPPADTKVFKSAKDNINVAVNKDELIVQLADELTNLKKAVFDKTKDDGTKVKTTVDGEGTVINEVDDKGNPKTNGNSASYKLDGTTVTDKDGNTTEVKADGTTVSKTTKDGDKETTQSTEYKADGLTIKHKGPADTTVKEVISIKNNNGNGEINFAKEDKVVEGQTEKVGTGKITGLADIKPDEKDGTLAANKNYVDSRIKDLADSSPIKYVDEEGKDLVKGKDGKIYRPDDIKDKKYVDGKGYVINPKDTNEKPVDDVKDAKAILDPNVKLDGVKSGIGLDKAIVEPKIKDDMDEAEKEAAKKEAADNFINNPLNEKDAKNAVNAEDLHEVSKALVDKGISFGADKGDATHKALGQTIKVNGGKNINTEIKGGNIEVNLDDKVELEEVKTGDSTLDTNGLKVSGPTKNALYEKDGTSIKGENGKSAEYKLDGATIKNEKGSAVLSPTSLTFNDNDGNSKVKIDGETASMSVGKVNVDGEKATITGLADLNEKSDGSSAANKNYVDSRVGAMETKFTDELGDASALNAALAGLKPLAYDPIRKSQFAAAMGYYKGKTAFALGLNHYTSENTLINGGVSFASGSNINNRRGIMLNLGITHKFGSKADIDRLPAKYQAGPISSVYVMQDEIQLLQKTNQEQAEIIKAQEAKAAAQDERITKLEEQIKELLKNK